MSSQFLDKVTTTTSESKIQVQRHIPTNEDLTSYTDRGVVKKEEKSAASISSFTRDLTKSKSISYTHANDADLSNPRSVGQNSSGSKATNDGQKKNTKKGRDRCRTIECLNLQTKPRFQKMTTDMFKTFLTPKSDALEFENKPLKRETSSFMERKYPMLKGPAPKPQIPHGKATIVQAKPETMHLPVKQIDSQKSLRDKPPKGDNEMSSEKYVSTGNLEVITKNKKIKYHKRGRGGKKVLDVSEHAHLTPQQQEEAETLTPIGTPEVPSTHKQEDEAKKPSEDIIKMDKNKITHKGSVKVADGSKKAKKTSLKTQLTGKNQTASKKRKPVVDDKLDIEHKSDTEIVKEIAVGDKIHVVEIEDQAPVVSPIAVDIAPSEPDFGIAVKSFELPDKSSYGISVEKPVTIPPNNSGEQITSKIRSKGTGVDKDLSVASIVDRPLERRSRDLIFKELLRTNDMLNQIEEPVVPRESFLGYPSSSSFNDGELQSDASNIELAPVKVTMEESSRELLPVVSNSTTRLLSMYEPRIHKSRSERAPRTTIKDEKPSLMDQKTISNLDVLTNVLDALQSEVKAGKTRGRCKCKNVRSTKYKKNRGQKKFFLQNKFTDNDFMKYFCKDWTQPEELITPKEKYRNNMKDSPQQTSVVAKGGPDLGDDSRSGFSDILDQIEDDELYDLIFTYRLPKTAPFDLKDTVNEARFKCIHKWLTETGNAAYRTAFEYEIKAKAEEKINEQLMEEMISLRRKIKRCDLCNKSTSIAHAENATGVSKFTTKEELEVSAPTKTTQQRKSVESTDSEAEIRVEYWNLMRKLQQSVVSLEDDEVLENVNADITSTVQGNYHSDQPSSKPNIVAETRGGKRRREIRELLEKLIELLKNKLKRMKTREIIIYKGGDEEGEIVTVEKELSFKSCHCQDEEKPIENKKLPVNHLDAILANFPVDISQFLKRRSVCQKPDNTPPKEMRQIKKFSNRNRLQLYMMNLVKTWLPPDSQEDHKRYFEKVADKRLIEKLEENNFKVMKKKRRSRNRKKINAKKTPNNQTETESVIHEIGPKIHPQTTKNRGSDADESKRPRIPFSCNCFCDRVSRLNPKRNQHFRTVLNEHFWCLRTDAHLLDEDFVSKKLTADEIPNRMLCPPQIVEQPDNFQGWLADTDRNLLLLMSRSPLDRIDKNYYKHTRVEKRVQLPILDKVDDENLQKQEDLQNLVNRLSQAQAIKFWETVDRWYEDYKKRDKIWQLLEVFKDVDLNAMLQRDLSLMKDTLAKNLENTKNKIRTRIEREKKEKFENDVAKLNASYACRMNNRLKAKEKEMKNKKAFLVRCMLVEAKENFDPVIEKYKEKCIEWIESLRDKQNKTSLLGNQRRARELALIADKYDVGERIRRKLVGTSGKEHEEVEKVLGKAIEARDIVIEGLKSQVVNLTRDVNIWKRAVGEVLKSFKKFVQYILETRPSRAQYVLSLEKLYQLQMDDLIRDANNELEKVETNEIKTKGQPSEPLQPTMEIKCPSHDVRYPSEHSRKTGSSSDTDIEEDIRARKVVDHAVDAVIRTVLPTREPSVEEEEEGDDLKELERLIRLWELDNSKQELKIESMSNEEEVECEEKAAEHERLVQVIGEGASDPCISVEEFTKRRIREMLEIIARKKPLIRPLVHL